MLRISIVDALLQLLGADEALGSKMGRIEAPACSATAALRGLARTEAQLRERRGSLDRWQGGAESWRAALCVPGSLTASLNIKLEVPATTLDAMKRNLVAYLQADEAA